MQGIADGGPEIDMRWFERSLRSLEKNDVQKKIRRFV